MRVALAAWLVLAMTSTATAATEDPSKFVLKLSDLPAGFAQDYSHHVSPAQARRIDGGYLAPGYRTGWASQYSRQAATGIIGIVSQASVYGNASQAHNSLQDSYRRVARSHKLRRLTVGSSLGDEARMYSYQPKSTGYKVIVYIVAWRSGNVKAAVTAGGILGTVDPGHVANLARKQQARIRMAS